MSHPYRLIEAAADKAARAIPPVWPLASSVAVNPFLGQTSENLAQTGARLARVAGAPVTMPRRWYQEKISAGAISDDDLEQAWASAPAELRPADLASLKRAAATEGPKLAALPTIANLAAEISGIDWPGLIAERFGAWAAGYFDEGRKSSACRSSRSTSRKLLRAPSLSLPAPPTGSASLTRPWKPTSIRCS
jgi:hypothetical protein